MQNMASTSTKLSKIIIIIIIIIIILTIIVIIISQKHHIRTNCFLKCNSFLIRFLFFDLHFSNLIAL